MLLIANFKDRLSKLSEAGASYTVVGACALSAHGVLRATGDLDIRVRPTAANTELVHQARLRFGSPAGHFAMEDLSTPGAAMKIGQPPHRMDVLTSIPGVELEPAWGSREALEVEGLNIPVTGREGLITNKRATGRAHDLAGVEKLAALDAQ